VLSKSLSFMQLSLGALTKNEGARLFRRQPERGSPE